GLAGQLANGRLEIIRDLNDSLSDPTPSPEFKEPLSSPDIIPSVATKDVQSDSAVFTEASIALSEIKPENFCVDLQRLFASRSGLLVRMNVKDRHKFVKNCINTYGRLLEEGRTYALCNPNKSSTSERTFCFECSCSGEPQAKRPTKSG